MNKLYRSARDNKITGLCGGLGQWLGIDPTVIRVLVVISLFFSFGTTALIYFVLSMFVPKEPFQGYTNSNYYY